MLLVVVAVLLVILCILLVWLLRKFLEPNFFLSPPPPFDPRRSLSDEILSCVTTAYSPKQREYDVIFVGSGLSALAGASFVLQEDPDQRVLILEQNEQLGGMCHTFEKEVDDEVYEFTAGVHFISCPVPFAGLWERASQGSIELVPLATRRYVDVCRVFPAEACQPDDLTSEIGVEYKIPHGIRNMTAYLKETFASDDATLQAELDLFCADARGCFRDASLVPMLRFVPRWIRPIACWFFEKFLRVRSLRLNEIPYLEYLLRTFPGNDSARRTIRSLLGRWCGIIGRISTSATSQILMSMASTHRGKLYPVGGTKSIVQGILRVVRSYNGEAYCLAPVKRILLDQNDVAIGVEMENGDSLFAKTVVSCVGIANTFGKLLPPSVAPSCLEEYATGSLHLIGSFLGFDCPLENLDIPETDFWILPDNAPEVIASTETLTTEEMEEQQLSTVMYVGNPNSVHPSGSNGNAGLACFIFSRHEHFRRWEGTKVENRGNEYEDLKRAAIEPALDCLYRLYPKLRQHVVMESLSSTLSTKHWTAWPTGEVYGACATSRRMFDMFDECIDSPGKVRGGLIMSGTDSQMTGGVPVALLAGLFAAGEVVGKKIQWLVQAESAHKKLMQRKKRGLN